MTQIKTEQLTKVYGKGLAQVTALKDVNIAVDHSEFVAVMGPSGCGKSTLLHLVGGLDQPTSGKVIIEGQEIGSLKDDQLTELRRRKIGFIFQFFNLIPMLSAQDNAALPLILDGLKPVEARNRADEWLSRLGLADRQTHRPDQLSGGEQQRVAIARALAADPTLILADEPTGNLDSRAADDIAGLLRKISTEWSRTILMVTHDPRIAAYADRIIFLKDGLVVDETRLAKNGQEEMRLLREKVENL